MYGGVSSCVFSLSASVYKWVSCCICSILNMRRVHLGLSCRHRLLLLHSFLFHLLGVFLFDTLLGVRPSSRWFATSYLPVVDVDAFVHKNIPTLWMGIALVGCHICTWSRNVFPALFSMQTQLGQHWMPPITPSIATLPLFELNAIVVVASVAGGGGSCVGAI